MEAIRCRSWRIIILSRIGGTSTLLRRFFLCHMKGEGGGGDGRDKEGDEGTKDETEETEETK